MGKKRTLSQASFDAEDRPNGGKPDGPAGYSGFNVTWPVPSRDYEFQDLYRKPPDFKQLALLDDEFAAFVKGRELDFSDPASVKQLTRTLLKLDFDLKIDLPDDRLCPPVAVRHNYILWLKSLLDTTSYEPAGRKLVGLDIGTGASCIYPLLGCTQRPWSFIATDVDEKSLRYARTNVKLNDLQSRINVIDRTPQDSLIPINEKHLTGVPETIDFVMTNPPFYESEEAMLRSASEKSRPPFTACTGAQVEMVTEGGEVAFVERILEESLKLRERVQWYTSMVGFMTSVSALLRKIKDAGIDNVAVTEFVQGNKTKRWAIAWSFRGMRPAQVIARGVNAPSLKGCLPPNTESWIIKLYLIGSAGELADKFSEAIGKLDLVSWEWDKERMEGVGRAVDNVWNRAWRRKKKWEAENHFTQERKMSDSEQKVAFGFKVYMRVKKEDLSISCRWLEGHDHVIFESFKEFLKTTARSLGTPKKR